MFLAKFSKRERKLIKRVALLQLEVLKNILNKDSEIDVELYYLKEGLPEDKMREQLLKNIKAFEALHEDPNAIFDLDQDHLSITKTIINKFFGKAYYEEARSQLMEKFIIMEYYITSKNRLN